MAPSVAAVILMNFSEALSVSPRALTNAVKFVLNGMPRIVIIVSEFENIVYFHIPVPVFGGPKFWEILCWNEIHWSSDLPKTMSQYMLVVFVVTLC